MGGAESKPGGSSKMDVSSDKQAGSSINKQKSSLVPDNQNKAGSTGPDESSTSPIAENQALMVTANVNTVGWGHEQASDTNGPSSQYGSQSQKQNSQGQNIHQHATKKDQGQPNQIPRHGQISAKGEGSTNTDKHQVGKDTTPDDCDLEIFLIGKTGHGKSSTGNTILGEKKFKIANTAESDYLSTDVGWTNRDGLTVKVVDGPGLLDTRLKSDDEQISKMEFNLSEGFLHCPNGFHALVLVLSYCGRFTHEERKTVAVLKRMLGSDFIRDHCIIVFTHGENFLMDNSDEDFKKWCGEQTGDLRKLLDECNNRVVLFHNQTPAKWDKSTSELISLARGLGQRYTRKLFNEIAKERSKFIEEQDAIQLKGPIQSKINLIISCLNTDQKDQYLDYLLDRLEKDIKSDNCNLNSATARSIKKGIRQTREKKYTDASETFENIELEGKILLPQFLKTVETIVRRVLLPALSVFGTLYKLYKRN